MGITGLMLLALAGAAPSPPASKCQASLIAELPVTMVGRRPMIDAKFGDKTARFIVDSGAFYSTISSASAAEFGLKVAPAPFYFRVKGIGGDSSAGVAESTDFSLSGIKVPKTDFIVGGSDTGTAGLIGQNILGLADVEYDLPHGAVRLMKTTGCGRASLAYWADNKPFTELSLEGSTDGPFKPHTTAIVLLNGVKIRATFDSGSPSSLLTLAAAKKLGVTPDSPGVVRAGETSGLGERSLPSWLASFETIDIGGELIKHPKIRMAPMEFGDTDMLIGADFFLTHRMFVSNAQRKIYITYEGGPVFGLSPKGAVTSDGKPLDLTDKAAAEPKTAEDFSRRGAVSASNRRLGDAIADFDKAIALAPNEARYFYQRGAVLLASGKRAQALADLDRAIELAPADPEARMTRARIRLQNGSEGAAKDDIAAADASLAPTSDKRFGLAQLYDRVDAPEQALANYDLWLKSHPEDSNRVNAWNGRCWARGQLNRDLDKALSDCNAAIKAQPNIAAYLDSRALIRLRRGEWDKAQADYDAAIKLSPRNAWSLYARSIVEARSGKADRAKADRDAALAIDPKVVERARRMGLEN